MGNEELKPIPRDDSAFRYLSREPAPHELGIPEGYRAPLDLRTATEIEADRRARRGRGLPSRSIVAAAIKLDGFTASVEAPGRHHDIINRLAATGFPTPIGGIQGFLTHEGLFVDRKIAMVIATHSNQLIPREGQQGIGGDLFSEDLW